MAGFASGFAQGFNNSFNSTLEKKEKQRESEFAIKYNKFLKDSENYNSTKRDQEQAAKQAELLAIDSGTPESAPFLYERIMNFGLDSVKSDLQAGKLTKVEGYTPQEAKAAEKTMDVQMAELYGDSRVNSKLDRLTSGEYSRITTSGAPKSPFSGQDSHGFTIAPREQPIKQADLGQLFFAKEEALLNGDQIGAERLQRKINAVTAAQSSLSKARSNENAQLQEFAVIGQDGKLQFISPGRSFTNPDGSQEVVYGPNSATLANGQTAIPMTPERIKMISEVHEAYAPKIDAYDKKVSVISEAFDVTGRMLDVARQDPRILSGAAGVTEAAVTAIREVVTGFDIIAEIGSGSGTLTEEELRKARDVEKQLQGIISDNAVSIGEKRAAFNALIDLTGYKFASLEGQEGRSLSNQDFERFKSLAGSSNSIEKFEQIVSGFLGSKVSALEGQRKLLDEGIPSTKFLEQQVGFDLGIRAVPLEERINSSDNGFAKEAYKLVSETSLKPKVVTVPQTEILTINSEEEMERFRKTNPVGTIFRDSYGETRKLK